jgi:dihydropyrimidinase
MAYKGLFQVDDGVLLNVFKKAKEQGILVGLHCENGDIISTLTQQALAAGQTDPIYHARTRPDYAEGEAIQRAATLAKAAGAPMYVVHLSSKAGLEAAMAHKEEGQELYLETCPQYLLLTEQAYLEPNFGGAKYVMSPPLRSAEDQEALWDALANGWVDMVATDHCAFNMKGPKEAGRDNFTKIPNGAPGLETRFGLLYTHGVLEGRISLNQFVSLVSTRPAQLMGMYPQKGAIAVGSDADLVIYNPDGESRIEAGQLHGHVDYTPFEGFKRTGSVQHVFLRGQHVVQHGKLHSEQAQGVFVRRKAI